ncbi:MAG: Na+/H+ antiporter NhaA [Planctomycetes bacterium]|nr:Na+/H+ antiporter NhaA [Planctomycetota bacterium]MCC7172827.1 Na+/H+ antiporter NhaA [Planctomycetota bacterium]
MTHAPIDRSTASPFLGLLRSPAGGGVLLLLATALAIVSENSGFAPLYDAFLTTPMVIRIGALELAKPLLLWINDGLMAVFFVLVGLEIKREVLLGELRTSDRAALPAFAALGGMLVPCAVFAWITRHAPDVSRGFAIPAATDIAFALGILAMLGSRVPRELKVFLTAFAILDDLGAIVLIASVYTEDLSRVALAWAAGFAVLLFVFQRVGVRRIAPYVVLGVAMWICVLKSGVHATLAGVVFACALPLRGPEGPDRSLAARAEHALEPWVKYAILPLFAFANAGLALDGIDAAALTEPLVLGIALGLFVGKAIGLFVPVWIAGHTRFIHRPAGIPLGQWFGTCLLGGVGFTMSLFIGGLAFEDPDRLRAIRLGVLIGSACSALAGVAVLFAFTPRSGGSGTTATTHATSTDAPDASPR